MRGRAFGTGTAANPVTSSHQHSRTHGHRHSRVPKHVSAFRWYWWWSSSSSRMCLPGRPSTCHWKCCRWFHSPKHLRFQSRSANSGRSPDGCRPPVTSWPQPSTPKLHRAKERLRSSGNSLGNSKNYDGGSCCRRSLYAACARCTSAPAVETCRRNTTALLPSSRSKNDANSAVT